jgi:hypothetical protein
LPCQIIDWALPLLALSNAPGHKKLRKKKKTEQAICVFQKYLQTRSFLYNDFVAQVITQSDSDGDFM